LIVRIHRLGLDDKEFVMDLSGASEATSGHYQGLKPRPPTNDIDDGWTATQSFKFLKFVSLRSNVWFEVGTQLAYNSLYTINLRGPRLNGNLL
jgi:hypothetical protein